MSNDPPARASLLGLPAELRNTIYQLILPETLQYLIFRDPHDLPRIPIAKEYHHAIPGTLQTCRRLRAEFLPVYYGTRKFSIIVIALSMSPNTALIKRPVQSLLTWLRELDGEARKALLHNVPSNTTISYKTNYRATEEWARTEYGPDLRGIWQRGQLNEI